MDIQKIISEMTLEEKIAFCNGLDFWHIKEVKGFEAPPLMMCDGPHGLRCQKGETDMLGINKSMPATCFPTAVTAAATWNPGLYGKEGEAIAEEALEAGVSVVLGPGCNIKRNPLGGRNFEYLSEDPYMAGKMAAAFIRGLQSRGVYASLKHFAVNNQEYKRQNGDSQLDQRTLREIYLTPFEIAVKEGKPGTVMCSYNKINGVHASDHKELLTDILRTEWGFDGLVMTDWGAMNDKVEAFKAGCDLNMPGGISYMEKDVAEAVRQGRLEEQDIDRSVGRILKLVEMANGASASETVKQPELFVKNHELALEIARQGAVLLKNEGNLLPASEKDMVLIGRMAEEMRYQGTGSSHINPVRLVSMRDALPQLPYAEGYDAGGNLTAEGLEAAIKAAKNSRIAVVAAGLPENYESEAFDREHMGLPEGHNRLIEAVAAVNPNTVVVLFGGSVMELPWADKVKAILYMGLPGQAGGQAAADLLTGAAVPCGKLTETWPLAYEDVISRETFGKKNTEYREGIYVGYRYYEKAGKAVRYPFGYGLSYTSFDYSDLQIQDRKVTVRVKNTGKVKGAEVVQLYVAAPEKGLYRPRKELKGFQRLELAPGEERTAEFTLDDRCFALWQEGWKVPEGSYEILVGASSQDIRLNGTIQMEGEPVTVPDWQKGSWYETLQGSPTRETWELLMGHPVPVTAEAKKGQFTMDNTCLEMMPSSWVIRLQYKITEKVIARSFGGRKDQNDPAYRMMLTCATDCPMRSVIISGGGLMSEPLAKCLLHMANGHYMKGLRELFR